MVVENKMNENKQDSENQNHNIAEKEKEKEKEEGKEIETEKRFIDGNGSLINSGKETEEEKEKDESSTKSLNFPPSSSASSSINTNAKPPLQQKPRVVRNSSHVGFFDNLPEVGMRYARLCRKLNVDEDAQRRGWTLLQRIAVMQLDPAHSEQPTSASTSSKGDQTRIWRACVVFIVGVFQVKGPALRQQEINGSLKLSALLQQSGVTVNELFNNVKVAMDATGGAMANAFDGFTNTNGQKVPLIHVMNVIVDSLKHLKHNYVVMAVFYEKFTFLWDISRNFADEVDGRSVSMRENACSFAWLLFVVARRRLFGKTHLALANLYSLLVAIINYARFGKKLRSDQKNPRNAEYIQAHSSTKREASTLSPPERKLAEFAKIENQDLLEMSSQVTDLIRSLLREGIFGTVSDDLNPLVSAEGLSSPANTEKLSRYYDSRYVITVCDFDERVFLDPRLHRQLASTPQRKKEEKTDVKMIDGASALHRGGKESHNFAKNGNEAKSSKRQLFRENSYGSLPVKNPLVSRGSPMKTSKSSIAAASPLRQRLFAKSPAPHGTPVSGAVEANNWLRRELQDAPVEPSSTLERYYSECDTNPKESIQKRVDSFGTILNKEYTESGPVGVINFDDENEAKQKPSMSLKLTEYLVLGTKLYHRTLESILLGEEDRLKTNNFTTLLMNEKFHRALYVWCIEVIFRSKEIFKLMYPKSAKLIGVSSFDLIKVVDCFIKYVPALPRVIRQHIHGIEENIMEEAAWRSESIGKVRDLTSQHGRSPQQNMFLRKLYVLAHSRIRKLCMSLFSSDSTGEMMRLVFATFKYAVTRHPDLLQDRHIDHLVLCSIYGIGKIKAVKPDLSFKRINGVYKNQRQNDPHSYNKVIREIVLDPPPTATSTSSANKNTPAMPPTPPVPYKQQQKKEKGDVIKFYNRVFLPRMKRFLLDMKHTTSESGSKGSGSGIPAGLLTPTKPSAMSNPAAYATSAAAWLQSPLRKPGHPSPHRVGSSNIYLSPRKTIHDSPVRMTPRTRALYAFGESPARDLHLINRAMTSQRRSRLRRGPRLDDDDDILGEQMAKRARIDRIETLFKADRK